MTPEIEQTRTKLRSDVVDAADDEAQYTRIGEHPTFRAALDALTAAIEQRVKAEMDEPDAPVMMWGDHGDGHRLHERWPTACIDRRCKARRESDG